MPNHGQNQNSRKTHCKHGHEFTPENTRVVKNGRACKACTHQYWLDHRPAPKRPYVSLIERFWPKVNTMPGQGPDGDCWEWRGRLHETGYGDARGYFKGKSGAHQVAYMFTKGQIPKGLHILHSCDNPKCVNPAHLRAGTRLENAADMTSRGRHSNQKKTHCPRGHEYTPENTLRVGRSRGCRECIQQRDRERRPATGKPNPPPNVNKHKTHCKRGHEFTAENTISKTNSQGPRRICKMCYHEQCRKDIEKRRQRLASAA